MILSANFSFGGTLESCFENPSYKLKYFNTATKTITAKIIPIFSTMRGFLSQARKCSNIYLYINNSQNNNLFHFITRITIGKLGNGVKHIITRSKCATYVTTIKTIMIIIQRFFYRDNYFFLNFASSKNHYIHSKKN